MEQNGAAQTLRVYVTSPHRVLREALDKLIRDWGHLATEASAADVALVDLCGVDPPYPPPPTIPTIALVCGGAQAAVEILRAGYKGYLFQDGDSRELTKALGAVLRGENWAERRIMATALTVADSNKPSPARVNTEALTPREREILDLIAKGLSNRAIADRLGIAEKTVKGYASSVYAKLGVRDRKDLIFQVHFG